MLPAMNNLPLAPYTVLDLTRARSGPTAVRQLAEMGANVIKIEARTDIEGDSSRAGFDFQNLHRNKRSITLDLKKPEGVAILKRLAAKADVLVENYRPDVKHRLGIDYETLSTINPRLVYGSISGFGQSGPYRDRPGYDQIAQGMGGLMSITGLPGAGPGASRHPDRRPHGRHVPGARDPVSRSSSASARARASGSTPRCSRPRCAMLDFQAARWLMGREIPPQAGNDHPTGIPTGVFKTRDGHMNIAASGQLMYRRLCTALGVPHLIDDARFKTVPDRSKHRKAMNEELDRACAVKTTAEWIDILNEAGVPCGPIYNVKEVYADPHVQHLGLAVEVKSPTLGEITIQNVPVTLSRTPAQVRTAAPDMGEHTDEVLREAGYTPEEIAGFRKDEVV